MSSSTASHSQKPHLRRRIPKRGTAASLRRRPGPTTPLLKWKLSDHKGLEGGAEAQLRRRASARSIAAGIWHLRHVDAAAGGDAGRRGRQVDPETVPRHLEVQLHCNPLSVDLHTFKSKKKDYASPVSVLSPKSCDFRKMNHLSGLPNSIKEKATKWDPESPMAAEELYRFDSHLKLLDEQEVNRPSLVYSLQTEIEQARTRISELEMERRLAKKKLDQFLKRLSEEKTAWRRREHEKVRAIIDGMRDDLKAEKKRRQRLEIVNSRLVNELAEAKLNAKRYFKDYEKERKSCEVIEEVCDELAKEIAEDKADIEALKMEALKIREEVEEEKKMLQMAEVWREERVQMKLVDARLTLEEKYSQLSRLKSELEAFMNQWRNSDADAPLVGEAELLRDQIDFVRIEKITEFSYEPPSASEDIYAVFEELQRRQETDEKEIQPCSAYTPTSQASNLNMASPSTDVFLEQPRMDLENDLVDSDDEFDDDSDWETASHDEDKGTNNSHDGSESCANGYYKKGKGSVGGVDREDNERRNLNKSADSKQCKKMVSSIYRFWRSSSQDIDNLRKRNNGTMNEKPPNRRMSNATLASNNSEENMKVSVDITNGRLSNAMASSAGALSPDIGFGELGFGEENTGHWSSPGSMNPHSTRGIKGCIDWSRNSNKHSIKSKLMGARDESQKVQLRQVLKQKM